MNRLALCVTALVLFVAAPAALPDSQTVSRAVSLLEGQEATFSQRFLPRGYKKEQVETGTVVFGAAPASRWSYEAPEAKTFVFDGETSWMYVPADESVIVHQVSAEEKRRLPFFVLSDPDRIEEWYTIRQEGRTTTMDARKDDAILRSIRLETDASGRLRTLAYTDNQGNRTTFELAGWKRAATDADTFTFTPPPGVDVIQN